MPSVQPHEAHATHTFDVNGGTPCRVGQLFFDPKLTAEVEELTANNANAQRLTLNSQEGIGIGQATVD
ncbi:hypothetical protein F5X97DRAFT_325051 [Nemania serpens]|nr:hypothetical protein F5X97DRAFT_325051 [Nemania serpens]